MAPAHDPRGATTPKRDPRQRRQRKLAREAARARASEKARDVAAQTIHDHLDGVERGIGQTIREFEDPATKPSVLVQLGREIRGWFDQSYGKVETQQPSQPSQPSEEEREKMTRGFETPPSREKGVPLSGEGCRLSRSRRLLEVQRGIVTARVRMRHTPAEPTPASVCQLAARGRNGTSPPGTGAVERPAAIARGLARPRRRFQG